MPASFAHEACSRSLSLLLYQRSLPLLLHWRSMSLLLAVYQRSLPLLLLLLYWKSPRSSGPRQHLHWGVWSREARAHALHPPNHRRQVQRAQSRPGSRLESCRAPRCALRLHLLHAPLEAVLGGPTPLRRAVPPALLSPVQRACRVTLAARHMSLALGRRRCQRTRPCCPLPPL